MLVLSRKPGEVIMIGNSVKITVISYDRGVVRLGIEAPKSIPVHRKEIHDKIVDSNRNSLNTEFDSLKNLLKSTDIKSTDFANKNIQIEKTIIAGKK